MEHSSIDRQSAKLAPREFVPSDLVRVEPPTPPVAVHPFPLSPVGRRARAEMRARIHRGLFFKESLFSDPAWDILLDLFIATTDGGRRTVSTVGLAGNVPQTTALRWVSALEAEGLIVREPDPLDGRRVFLDLSEAGFAAMTRYFQVASPR